MQLKIRTAGHAGQDLRPRRAEFSASPGRIFGTEPTRMDLDRKNRRHDAYSLK